MTVINPNSIGANAEFKYIWGNMTSSSIDDTDVDANMSVTVNCYLKGDSTGWHLPRYVLTRNVPTSGNILSRIKT